MLIDTIWKNIGGYIGWAALAVAVGVLQDVHRQLANGQPPDLIAVLDAGIVSLLPVLIVMLGSMKQPSVGHERRRPNPDDERAAEQKAEQAVAKAGKG